MQNMKSKIILKKQFKNKVVLVTGHTGFKGSWLSAWLSLMGAKIIGVSLDKRNKKSHLNYLKFIKMHKDYRFDISDYKKIKNCIAKSKPDFVFHLAAQSLVGNAYENPLFTWKSNSLLQNEIEGGFAVILLFYGSKEVPLKRDFPFQIYNN